MDDEAVLDPNVAKSLPLTHISSWHSSKDVVPLGAVFGKTAATGYMANCAIL